MIPFVFLVLAAAAVLSVYTVIGRLAVPPEDRVPWRDLGWDGWVHTLRRSLVFLGDVAPRVGAGHPTRPSKNVVAPSSGRQAAVADDIPMNARPLSGPATCS
ncbi:hypothetical protein [Kocuria rosea]|uniref:Uncharacterized protein n=1 Tax=Kocuria rosea TaxID=1275 RepID=A0A4R5YHB2_KOCRO|nr:hypothetical protein [Kocuria rosea]TDL44651.1 hypothetical protein E2R59_06180 [Kocuria rosea]